MSCVRNSSGQNNLFGLSSLVSLSAAEVVVEIEVEDDGLDLKRAKIFGLRDVAVPASVLPLSTPCPSRLSSHVC